ncbi:MAG: threonine synthase [Phycisphaerae bacterium]
MKSTTFQQCVVPECAATFGTDEVLTACKVCGALLDIRYEWDRVEVPSRLSAFDERRSATPTNLHGRLDYSGVWRFRELIPLADDQDLVTIGEGRTALQQADLLAKSVGMREGHLHLQYEGFNPSGSFKDNGMAAAFTVARFLDRPRVACASTGNTSAALALFAAQTHTRSGDPMRSVVFIGDAKIAFGKLSQALDYGARTLQIAGDFDDCMRLVRVSAESLGLYLMNSVNPFRLEGQKAIMFRVLEGLNWEVPDWIIVPGGNLGNSSAFGKAFMELHQLGLIDRLPRLAVINAAGANTLFELYEQQGLRFESGSVDMDHVSRFYADRSDYAAQTVASAIEIGRPVNLVKSLRSLAFLSGVVREVDDAAILEGKAAVGRYGYGCEPASGASVAGLRQLLHEQVISPSDRVVCILTGHQLKDPNVTVDYHMTSGGDALGEFANQPIRVAADVDAIERALQG